MMSKPNPDLDKDRDWDSLHRITTYVWHEYCQVTPMSSPFRFLWDWKAYRRWRKLGPAVDVLHELSRELSKRGQLNSPTMFSGKAQS
jgi:hypothetical protein